ncbi:MAG: RluA family pseudouridine synthase [Saprospiraceae bacterium]|nr:RluA family pseudouridine synthase [Saprospiraceae bacterium]
MQILFEDQDLLVVNKPAGLSTESGTAAHPSAEKEALAMYRRQLDAEGSRLRLTPYLRAVHRLDRASSGVLVLAKSKAALSDLMRQFEDRSVEKIYQARVQQALPETQGSLQHWLKRDESGKRALVFDVAMPEAQPCRLDYKTLEVKEGEVLLEIRPKTGRFHQIRAQLAHVGAPIIGDEWYGGAAWRPHEMLLHAVSLAFVHPRSGQKMMIEAPWRSG